MIDLRDFCLPEKEHIAEPFDLDGYTIGTNAVIVARTPGATTGRTVPPGIAEKIRGGFAGPWRSTRYLLAACFHDPEDLPCSLCTGTGLIRVCPSCGGGGCGSCHGRGCIPSPSKVLPHTTTCEDCDGTGRYLLFRPVLIEDVLLGGVPLQLLIRLLPGDAEIRLGQGQESPALITATGVEAALMPLRANSPSVLTPFRPTFPRACEAIP